MDLVAASFITPYSQPALDGAEGLTSADIAKSLGIRPRNFRVRFFELEHDKLLAQLGLNFAKTAQKLDSRGRPEEVLVFPTDVARVLVANYPNEIGMGYAVWLVQRAHHHYEAVVEDNIRLRNENHTLAGQAKRSLPRTKKPLRRKVIQMVGDLLGGVQVTFAVRPVNSLTEWQKDLVHVPAMMHQARTLIEHVGKRVEKALQQIEVIAEHLGIDSEEARNTVKEAIDVMISNLDDPEGNMPN